MRQLFRYLRIFLRLSGWIGVLVLWAGIAIFANGLDLSAAAGLIGEQGQQTNVTILDKKVVESTDMRHTNGMRNRTAYYLTFVLTTPEEETAFSEKVTPGFFSSVEVGQSVPITYLPGKLAMHEFAANGLETKSMAALIVGAAVTLLGVGLMIYYLRRLFAAIYIIKHGVKREGIIAHKRLTVIISRMRIAIVEDGKVIANEWSFWRFPFAHAGRHRKDGIEVMYDPTGKGKAHWCGDLR